MAGFPKLIPAFTVVIAPPQPISPTLKAAHFLSEGGKIVSEPGYAISLNAAIEHGADYIRTFPDGRHVRLDVDSTARDAGTGALVRFRYTGKISTLGAAGRVLRGEAQAPETTPFGEAFSVVEFETGSEALAALHEKVYVGSGRFILEPGKPVTVEYKVSEVSA
ncbi:11973d1d-9e32-4cfa-ab6a-bc70fd2a408b [Thermothielavioides terrestris]|uniref:11973d1d-9e32-4cfa-ab6a-bc70fd2a408b n=1 Tax=Thermothielavioides terrestris TaxID=2587410 RepID=A0A446B6N5_9PEZI|nr:11973d1d-9e32-4cfa-ab6a-bc70fd2a408b [Thermothielavioides terrestris]